MSTSEKELIDQLRAELTTNCVVKCCEKLFGSWVDWYYVDFEIDDKHGLVCKFLMPPKRDHLGNLCEDRHINNLCESCKTILTKYQQIVTEDFGCGTEWTNRMFFTEIQKLQKEINRLTEINKIMLELVKSLSKRIDVLENNSV